MSMEILTLWNYFWSLTVVKIISLEAVFCFVTIEKVTCVIESVVSMQSFPSYVSSPWVEI